MGKGVSKIVQICVTSIMDDPFAVYTKVLVKLACKDLLFLLSPSRQPFSPFLLLEKVLLLADYKEKGGQLTRLRKLE